ncbi:MAG: hypothetical protein AAB403_22100 [Planctomycetota bacterium]
MRAGKRADQPAIVATPLLSTMMSRCRARERNWTVPSRRHISVRMVSPGKTGAEKRREMAVSLDGSYPQHDLRMASKKLSAKMLAGYDVVLISTDHSDYDYGWIVRNAKLVVDARNATAGVRGARGKVVKA